MTVEEEDEQQVEQEKNPERAEKPKEESQQLSEEEEIGINITKLQNNGLFRYDLLYRIDKLNTYLEVIAESLIKLTGEK